MYIFWIWKKIGSYNCPVVAIVVVAGANAALARKAIRISEYNTEKKRVEFQEVATVKQIPPLKIVEDIPEQIEVTIGEPIIPVFQVASLGIGKVRWFPPPFPLLLLLLRYFKPTIVIWY
jgi:hypothetical protein